MRRRRTGASCQAASVLRNFIMSSFLQAAFSSSSALTRRSLAIVAVLLALAGCLGEDGSDSPYAQIRLLNVSPDYSSLDLYVNAGSSDTDSLKFQGVAFEVLSNYSKVDSTVYNVKLKRNGVSSTLGTLSDEKQADDTHVTYVAYGATGKFGVLKINDDQTAANDKKTKVQVLNVSQAGSLDVYLTDASVSLDDGTPQFAAVANGGTSSTGYLDSGTYRLRVVGTGDTSDLRLDVPEITLGNKDVVSLILTATPGGVLVSALVLPQKGSFTAKHNTKARVRGAVGVSTGVTASIGGVTLLTGAGAGVISSRYALVDAGSAAADLRVGGVAVPVASQQLAAGGDYTMLIWSNADGVHLTAIGDNNSLPESGTAKLRVMNGLSGVDAPVTLAVDFSPVAEGIADGQASGYTEFDTSSEYQLDVSDTNTTQPLVSKTSVALAAESVYTLLVSGGATAAGTLRKDR